MKTQNLRTMEHELTISDLNFILESLEYTRKNFEEYELYPSYEYKQKRIGNVNDVMEKVRTLKQTLRKL